jgi:hypothetical protein
MKTRKLGNSNLDVSAIGLGSITMTGGYSVTPDRGEKLVLIRAAVERGVTFFDTAQFSRRGFLKMAGAAAAFSVYPILRAQPSAPLTQSATQRKRSTMDIKRIGSQPSKARTIGSPALCVSIHYSRQTLRLGRLARA